MSLSSEPRASASVRTGLVRTAISVAVAAASLAPATARAVPPIPQVAEEHYERGTREREAGRYAAAAAEFEAAYAEIPPARKEQRATVLFELVDVRRSAFAASGKIRGKEHPAAHLCAAQTALGDFIDAAQKDRPRKGKKSDDEIKATELRAEVEKQLDAARKSAPDLDCATVEYPREDAAEAPAPEATSGDADRPKSAPRPRRSIHKPFVIAGGVTTGVGLILLGVMAGGLVRGKRAEADGDALVSMHPTEPADSDALQEIDHDGKVGNRMAIAGGVLGTLALGTGVALLVIGLRGGPARRVAVSPTMSPRALGVALRWQF